MTALFIDVSYHDWDRRGGALDWAAIAGAGLGGVMCARASYGDPQVFNPPSPRFAEYMAGAKANGFTARGAYHNLIKGDAASIARQVDLLRSTMDRFGGEWALADIEAYPELVTRGLVSDWATVQRFRDRWYAVESRVMAWYIGRGFWAGNIGSANLTGLRGPLIGPRYPGVTGAPASAYTAAGGDAGNGWAPYGGRVPDIWQYSSTVTVPGASSKTDCNAYRGSLAALVALLAGGTGTVPSGGTDDMDFNQAAKLEAVVNASPTMDLDIVSPAGQTTSTAKRGTFPVPLTVALRRIEATLNAVASRVDIDPAELAAIKQASTAGAAAAFSAGVPVLVDALYAKLPPDTMTREQLTAVVEHGVRDAFAGGLAPDPTPSANAGQ